MGSFSKDIRHITLAARYQGVQIGHRAILQVRIKPLPLSATVQEREKSKGTRSAVLHFPHGLAAVRARWHAVRKGDSH